ncbi:toll-like receptor 1 [Pecten maximus]|uniref:toll-like receptor 1 n=1 Tax=Pecten maximus TaxID=6579 RepID=UPI0014584826|nr:toll-like receptor 1 [Pecten maximus]
MENYLLFLVICVHWTVHYSDGLPDCCSVQRLEETFEVTCPGCRLQVIPQDEEKNTTSLNLMHNNVKILLKESFINMPHLEHIVLSFNSLSVISTGTFHHLVNLTYLDLSHNLLDGFSFEASAFNPRNNLKTLIMYSNNFHLRKVYPEPTLLSLSQIETLHIDIFDGLTFGEGFLNLNKMKTLSFKQRGELSIRNTSFQRLESMDIHKLSLFFKTEKLERNALHPFRNLSKLCLTSRRYRDVRDVLPLLHGLRGRTMESIEILHNYVRNDNTVHLENSDIRFFSAICIRKLNLSNNAIGSISIEAVLSWASRGCIEYLDLSRNTFQSPQVFFILKLFPSIQYFDCSYKTSTFMRKRRTFKNRKIYLPDSLIYLNLRHFKFTSDFGRLGFIDKNLKILDISYQEPLFTCGGHRFNGLSHLTEFDMSGIVCSFPHPEMFTAMLNLTKLTARECLLGYSGLVHNKLFQGLTRLTTIDLSSNKIRYLNSSTFKDQSDSMKMLLLADNLIESLPIQSLVRLKVLELLDIRNNLIASLTYSEITLLENYRSVSERFRVKLAGNPVLCDCNSLDFLSWIATTQVIYDKDDIVCINSHMKIVEMLETFHDFRIDCTSQFWLIISISLTVIFLVLGIMFRLAWRYSVNLRFWCRHQVEHETPPYDIFISYCREDCRWIRKSFTTWLEQHDIRYSAEDKTFETGLDICDNIMRAIDDSYQTLFVVSCKFLEYEWQTFAMKVASRYSFREGRERMNIIILLDDMKRSEFPKLIRENWDIIRPLQWPDEHNTDKTRLRTARKLFWEKLLKRVRKGNKRLASSINSESTV